MKGGSQPRAAPAGWIVVMLCLAGLAAAMGIGRFAFTPILPLMQQHQGVGLAQGAWLATANYVGYLLGAMGSLALLPAPGRAIRWGLVAVAGSTAAMAVGDAWMAWLAYRLVAGAASAFVLIGVSAWSLSALGTNARADLTGWVFSGVGFGILAAGLVTLALAQGGAGPRIAWLLLAAVAAVIAAAGWHAWRDTPAASAPAPAVRKRVPLRADEWLLIVCYGAFGLGYIIPATFLPAMARALVPDPQIFGWAWPLFGAAAAVSTIVVMRFTRYPPRAVAVGSLIVMAIGVAAPVVSASLAAVVVSALCVGATFMVMTMAGFQEARRIADGPPARLIAAMTAAFALGQLIGPMLVAAWASAADPARLPSALAAVCLLAAAAALALNRSRAARPVELVQGRQ